MTGHKELKEGRRSGLVYCGVSPQHRVTAGLNDYTPSRSVDGVSRCVALSDLGLGHSEAILYWKGLKGFNVVAHMCIDIANKKKIYFWNCPTTHVIFQLINILLYDQSQQVRLWLDLLDSIQLLQTELFPSTTVFKRPFRTLTGLRFATST